MLFPVPDTRTVATSSVPPAGGGTWPREGSSEEEEEEETEAQNLLLVANPRMGGSKERTESDGSSKGRATKQVARRKGNNSQRLRSGTKRRKVREIMDELWPGIEVRFRGDRFKGLDKSKTTKLDYSEYLGRRIGKYGIRVGAKSVLTKKDMQCKCLFLIPWCSSKFWALFLVSRVTVNFTS